MSSSPQSPQPCDGSHGAGNSQQRAPPADPGSHFRGQRTSKMRQPTPTNMIDALAPASHWCNIGDQRLALPAAGRHALCTAWLRLSLGWCWCWCCLLVLR